MGDRVIGGILVGLFISSAALSCSGRSVGNQSGADGTVPDGRVLRDSGTGPDGGARTDGTVGICEMENHLFLRPVDVGELYAIQPDSITVGQTMRVAVGVYHGGCDPFGQVEVQVDPAAAQIEVQAFVWRIEGEAEPCIDEEVYTEEFVALSDLDVGTWRVASRPVNGPALETAFTVLPCPAEGCSCIVNPDLLRETDEPCPFDCYCREGLKCLTLYGFGGPYSACGRNCSVNANCPAGLSCRFYADGPWGVCGEDGVGDDCVQNGCPDGMVCIVEGIEADPFCQANFNPADLGRFCSCDEECGEGLVCVDWQRLGEQQPECGFPCRGDRQCPSGGACGDGWPTMPPVCYYLQL